MARTTDELSTVLRQFVQLVTDRVPVTKVILYGSHARGDARDLSDIDLVVISPSFGQHKLQDLRLLAEVAMECEGEIQALPYSTIDLQQLAPGTFLEEVLRTGRVIYPEPEQ